MKTTLTRFGIRSLTCGMIAFAALAPAMAEEGGAKSKNMLDTWVIAGGWTMIPLVLLLIWCLYLLTTCLMSLKREKFCPEALRGQLISLMGECRVQSAIQLATQSPTYLGRLVAYSLPNVDANRPEDLGKDAVEDSVVEFAGNERPAVLLNVDILALIGAIAPSIGLFGTIQGMVLAFETLATAGSADPSQLAGSISVALLTTFWGLIISIIALPAFFFLKKHAQKLESECVNTVAEMMNTSINVINAEAQLARIPEGLNAEEGEEGEGELIEGQEA